jgi:uncharacterized protein involved in exopolysaccharide biosynthesis
MAFVTENTNKELVKVPERGIVRVSSIDEFPEINVRDLAQMLKRGLKTAMVVWLAIILGGYAALMYMTEQYQADAKLLVKLGRENAEVPLGVEKGGIFATGVQKEEINSYINLLTSQGLIEETVDAVGVERYLFKPEDPETLFEAVKFYVKASVRQVKQIFREVTYLLDLKKRLTDREQTAKLVQKSLSVTRDRDSNVISLELRLPDGELAEVTLNTLIDRYLERHVNLRRNVDIGRVFESQTDAYRVQLQTLQDELTRVRTEWDITSIPEQRAAMIERLQELKGTNNDRVRDLNRISSEEAAIRKQLELLPDRVISAEVYEANPSVRQIRERLVELEVRRVTVASNYRQDSEQVRRIDQEIMKLKALLAEQDVEFKGASTYEPHHQREKLLNDLADVEIKKAGLRAAIQRDAEFIEASRAELTRLSEGESRLTMLDLEWRVLQQKFLTNATRREEASIAEAMDLSRVANIAVLSPPTVSAEPVSPKRILLFAINIALGLFIGFGVAVIREWRSDLVYTETDVYRLEGIYPLGEVSLARI